MVQHQVTRRMDRELWSVTSAREDMLLGEMLRSSDETTDQRSQRDCSEGTFSKILDRCIAVNCHGSV